jgi:serine/threonine protein kinase
MYSVQNAQCSGAEVLMTHKDSRLIGSIYRIGQVISSSNILTTCTAYHHYTNDVVGLSIIEIPKSVQLPVAQQLLQPLNQRRTVNSPHVLHVHDFGIDGSRAYIVTDSPRGLTLRYVLETENIDLQRALDLALQLTRGVQALHEQQIHTLDLRPALITIDTLNFVDRAQVDDVGIRTLLSKMGYTHGQKSNDFGYLDPRYAPPEYINYEQSGPWSDTYQLGLLFFELITGRPPFVGQNAAETGILQNSEPVPQMNQYNHETPSSFQDFAAQALQKDPQKRFASGSDMLAALSLLQVPMRYSWRKKTDPRDISGGLTDEIPEMPTDPSFQIPNSNDPEATGKIINGQIPSGSEIYAYLSFEKDGTVLHRFPLTKPVSIIGRLDPKRNVTPDIDLTELDPKMTISRQHARIRFEKTFFYIEDLKSRNKTRLGELVLTPLKPEIIQHGDSIAIGKVRLKFEIPGMSEAYVFKERK